MRDILAEVMGVSALIKSRLSGLGRGAGSGPPPWPRPGDLISGEDGPLPGPELKSLVDTCVSNRFLLEGNLSLGLEGKPTCGVAALDRASWGIEDCWALRA